MDTSAKSSHSQHGRIAYLDALRGVAASSVAFKHHLLVFGVPASLEWLRPYLPQNFYFDGSPEVSFFFVLSGFVLSVGFFNGRAQPEKLSLWRTYFARVTRIYPAFLAIFLLSLIAKNWAYSHVAGAEHLKILNYFWPTELSFAHGLKQITLMPFAERGVPLVSPDWTLICEVKYSLFLPFLLLATKNSRLWLAALTALLIANLGEADYLLSGFSIGILLAATQSVLLPRLHMARAPAKWLLLLAILFLYYLGPALPASIMFTSSLAGGLVLCLAFASRRLQKLLDILPMRFLGKISYSIYLSHFLVLLSVAPYWRGWTASVEWSFAWDMAFFAACVLLLSSFLYYFAEKPGICLGRRVRKSV